MKAVVLDASALMVFLHDRPGAEKVEELLRRATERKIGLLMSVVNWGEVYYSIWRTQGKAMAERTLIQITRLPIKIVEADFDLTKLAAEFRAQYKLPYADCFAAALAHQSTAMLATGDKDFEQVAKRITILWTT